ncbi:MAG: hypothetical protein KF739_00825 [Cryobacterium sp.]|nr:hypothetical protein [Micrococcales bacterium]MBX3308961.1 hypothetical protein [Cryobacterium sp.]
MHRTSGNVMAQNGLSHRGNLRVGRVRRFAFFSLVLALLGVSVVGPPAWAHGGDGVTEGYVIVQQALSYLVNDTSPAGTMKALEKVDEVLIAEDQDGVDVAEVEQAKTALSAGDTKTAQTLLQGSITEAVAALKPAVGEETGTTTMLAPYAQGPLTGTDWAFLVLSVLAAVGGTILAMWLRPRQGLRELRHDILAGEDKTQSTPLESKGSESDAR